MQTLLRSAPSILSADCVRLGEEVRAVETWVVMPAIRQAAV